MPSKSRQAASTRRYEQRVKAGLAAEVKVRRVPVIGGRVAAALHIAEISNANAARQLTKAGVNVTAQAINDIVNGRTKTTHPKIRSGLAKLAGRPFTARFLGGEREIEIPPMPIVLSRRDHWWAWGFADAQNLIETKTGLAYTPPRNDEGMPALYETFALVLYSRIEEAWKRDFRNTPVSQRLHPLLRRLLALAHWRGLVSISDNAASKIDSSFWADAGEFAEAMLTATSLILKPWFDGKVRPRRYMLSALHHFLEASNELGEALSARESVPNAEAIRREVSAKWFGGRLVTNNEMAQMAAFAAYRKSEAELSKRQEVGKGGLLGGRLRKVGGPASKKAR